MMRITIVSAFSLLLALAASTGCSVPTGTEDDDSDQTPRRLHMVAVDGQGSVDGDFAPAHTLELSLHLHDDSSGPHPEPWLDRVGPHPEPWQGDMLTTPPVSDPDSDPNSKDDVKKR